MNILPHENYLLYGITTWIETNLIGAPVARARDAVAAGSTFLGTHTQLLHNPVVYLQLHLDAMGLVCCGRARQC